MTSRTLPRLFDSTILTSFDLQSSHVTSDNNPIQGSGGSFYSTRSRDLSHVTNDQRYRIWLQQHCYRDWPNYRGQGHRHHLQGQGYTDALLGQGQVRYLLEGHCQGAWQGQGHWQGVWQEGQVLWLQKEIEHQIDYFQAEISRECRLRSGAEKLLTAASANIKLREAICLELSIINNNLQSMREVLSDLALSIHSQYCTSTRFNMQSITPSISVSCKETQPVDFLSALKDILSSHYYEDYKNWKQELNSLHDHRQKCCSGHAVSSDDVIDCLFSYYNQLYFIDRRFFPTNSLGPITFLWYDSLTGLPYAQNTIGFEKGSVLFNIGAHYSQRAARLMCNDVSSLEQACTEFRRAAGAFKYLADNFCNSPSIDMNIDTVNIIILIMLAQAAECELSRTLLLEQEIDIQGKDDLTLHSLSLSDAVFNNTSYDSCTVNDSLPLNNGIGAVDENTNKNKMTAVPRLTDLAQQAAHVMSLYDQVLHLLLPTLPSLPNPSCSLPSSIPPHWYPTLRAKRQYFSSLAHSFIAQALTTAHSTRGQGTRSSALIGGPRNRSSALIGSSDSSRPSQYFQGIHVPVGLKVKNIYSDQLIHDRDGLKTLARSHLRQSILASEESLSITSHLSKQKSTTIPHLLHLHPSLPPLNDFQRTIKTLHDRSMSEFSLLEEEDDFTELLLPPDIQPKATDPCEVIVPDFSKYKVEDVFYKLGCISIFSARHHWTEPRIVRMCRRPRGERGGEGARGHEEGEGGEEGQSDGHEGEEFGFSVRGDSPVIIATVDDNSLAQRAGLRVGDFIVSVGEVEVKWTRHERVVEMIRESRDSVILRVVTPTDHNYIDPSLSIPLLTTPSTSLHPPSSIHPTSSPSPLTTEPKGPVCTSTPAQRSASSMSKALHCSSGLAKPLAVCSRTTPRKFFLSLSRDSPAELTPSFPSDFKVKERSSSSSFTWKLRKRKSLTQDKSLSKDKINVISQSARRSNPSNHSYS